MTTLILSFAFFFSNLAFAGNGIAPDAANIKPPNPGCGAIRDACKLAGFRPKGSNLKGANGKVKECIKRWAEGEKIPGIVITPQDPAGRACAEHQAGIKAFREREAELARAKQAALVPAVAPQPAPGQIAKPPVAPPNPPPKNP